MLLFMDSFDHYDDAADKYLAGGTYLVPGRHGKGYSQVLRCALNPTSPRMIFGAAFRFPSTYNYVLTLYDQGDVSQNEIASITTQNDGCVLIKMFGGPSALSPADVVRVNQWHYIECDLTVQTSCRTSGSTLLCAYTFAPARVYVDGALVLDVASIGPTIEHQGSSLNGWRFLDINQAPGNGTVDDLYILDGSGPSPWNAPLGDVRIDVIRPNGVGAVTQWTPVGATDNWDAMNDPTPDDDATRVVAPTAGLDDLYQLEDVNTQNTILGAQILISASRTAEGFASLTPLLRHAGVTYPLVTRAITPSYFYRNRDCFVAMPNGDPLTDANMNALQAGLRRSG